MAEKKALDPTALTVEEAAKMLGLPRERLEEDIGAGALTNADGTVNLLHYAAWLNMMAREDDRGET